MEYALLAVLAVVSLTYPTVMLILARKWRAKQDAWYQQLRRKLIEDLGKAKEATENERRRLAVIQSETYLDTQMLQLACQELSQIWDEETESLCYDGDWRVARNCLKDLVVQHNRSWNKEQEQQLHQTYSVPVDPA